MPNVEVLQQLIKGSSNTTYQLFSEALFLEENYQKANDDVQGMKTQHHHKSIRPFINPVRPSIESNNYDDSVKLLTKSVSLLFRWVQFFRAWPGWRYSAFPGIHSVCQGPRSHGRGVRVDVCKAKGPVLNPGSLQTLFLDFGKTKNLPI